MGNSRYGKTEWDNMSHEEKLAQLYPYGHLQVGDKAWAIVGPIAIKVVVEEIQDWRKPDSCYASVEYWVDEPIGHALSLDASTYSSLCPTKEKAVEVLHEMLRAEVDHIWDSQRTSKRSLEEINEILLKVSTETIEVFRGESSAFIRSTLVNANSTPEELAQHDEYAKTHYRFKTHLEEWFNYGDILAGNV